jgi:HPt (histidine-containing phosphotransfer) domain-containing protein
MVDHVTKPIDPNLLVTAILSHWQVAEQPSALLNIGLADVASVTSVTSAVSTDELGAKLCAVLDWPGLLAHFGGRRVFVEKLIRTLLSSHGEIPAKLRAAAREQNLETIDFLSHTLKGMSGNLLAVDVEELAARTNNAARAGDVKAFELAMDLATMFESFMAALEQKLT